MKLNMRVNIANYGDILSLLKTDQEISRSQILEWMKSNDIKVLGALYKLTCIAYYRIKPELGMETSCDYILKYYTRCIIENPNSGDCLHNRHEAGMIMSAWIKHLWNKRPETDKILAKVEDTLAELYLSGDKETQDCIIYFVLEHVFKEKGINVLFKKWKKKRKLRKAYEAAIELWTRTF